jgi:alpha/beta superfamily hydrolase
VSILFPEESLFIQGSCGNLEALIQGLEAPTASRNDHKPKPIAIICHPHPLYGGSFRNKVVHTLNKTFQELGIATIRFNFRGVGKSEGHYDAGVGEADDLKAVLNWAQRQYPNHPIWLAGFSFGAYIALKVAPEYLVAQLILAAPPVKNFPVRQLALPDCPVIVVQGDADEVVPAQMVFDWANSLSPKPTLIRFENASHFFHGRLNELRERLLETISRMRDGPA